MCRVFYWDLFFVAISFLLSFVIVAWRSLNEISLSQKRTLVEYQKYYSKDAGISFDQKPSDVVCYTWSWWNVVNPAKYLQGACSTTRVAGPTRVWWTKMLQVLLLRKPVRHSREMFEGAGYKTLPRISWSCSYFISDRRHAPGISDALRIAVVRMQLL